MKVYRRTENGATTYVSIREGMDEINHAMMGGRRDVREMSSITRTDFAIEYKDGRMVRLVQVDAPAPEEKEPEAADVREWSGTYSRFNHLHRVGANGRARCNSRIRPRVWSGPTVQGVVLHTRADIEAREHAHLYTFCPSCEAK